MASNRLTRLLKIITGTNAGEGEELLQLEGRVECSLHFMMLVWRHFVRNRCLIRASALAYTTLLALIPLLALVISVSSSLLKNQDEDKFYQAIASIMPPAAVGTNAPTAEAATNDVAVTGEIDATNMVASAANNGPEAYTTMNPQKELAHWLHQFVQNSQGGKLGLFGMIVFVFIAIMMLSRIEETFNDIWGVSRGRNWLTRVVLYWAAITLGPVLILTALSLSGSAHFQGVKDYFHQVPVLGKLILDLLPLVLLWFTFTFIYQIVPNTRVRFSAALAGGVVAGTAWHLNNVFGFLYVSRAIGYSNLYGGLYLIPVFMLGLYFSWAILLFGAQLAYAFQNRAAYLQDKLADNVNQRGREFVALRIMTLLGQRFQNGMRPATVSQLSAELGVPSRLTQHILRILGNACLVTEVGGGMEAAYVPARPLDSINAHHILLALRSGTGRDLPVSDAPALAEIYGEFARIEAAERSAAEKITMLALVPRALPALSAPEVTAGEAKASEKSFVELPRVEEIRVPEVLPVAEPEVSPVMKAERFEKVVAAHGKIQRETVLPEERDFPL